MQKTKEAVKEYVNESAPLELMERNRNDLIDLSNTNIIDLVGLSPDEKQAMIIRSEETKIDLAKKAVAANIDLQGTKNVLDTLNASVRTASEDGTHITMTHTQKTSIGTTEVSIGNTERAASGKISRSGQGQKDNQLPIAIVAAVACVLIALVVA